MLIIIAYDISQEKNGIKRLQKVSKLCEKHGQRIQNSLFECNLDWGRYLNFKNSLEKLIDKNLDSIIIYNLGNNWDRKVEHIGIDNSFNPHKPIII